MLGATASAAIWRVNNNTGVDKDFTSIQEAVNNSGVADGDTIHVENSVTPYDPSGVAVGKRLCIFGPGFYLTANPETQHIKMSAKVSGNITFSGGSAGSVLAGIEQTEHTAQLTPTGISSAITAWTGSRLTINESNIKIINCKLNWVDIKNDKALSDIDIRKCWFCPGLVRTTAASEVLNLNIINNFFRNDHATSSYTVIDLNGNTKGNIGYNTFYGGFKINALKNCRITNNVFYATVNRVAAALTSDASNTYSGNISNIDLLGSMTTGQNGNTIRTTETTEALSTVWFAASGGVTTVDKYFVANSTASSPIRQAAAAAGVTGELGMFGGLSAYVLSGMTNIPSVYEIVMPTEVSSDGFDVTVKVKAH
jgi:hypothetical protein